MKKLLQFGVLVAFLLPLFLPTSLSAQTEAERFKIDSSLYAYYQKCKAHVNDSIVLKMSDTLYRMSEAKKDIRMQAVALSTIVDYYYYRYDEKMILQSAKRVMEFAKKTNQSKYYYFTWGQRIIMFYVHQDKNVTALYEAEKMLKEAQKEDDKVGISTCYRCLATIYTATSQSQQAFHYAMEEAEFIKKHNLDNYNISLLYKQIAAHYIQIKDYTTALTWLKKADSTAHTAAHRLQISNEYMGYYLGTGQQQKAYQTLEAIRSAIRTDKKLSVFSKNLEVTEYVYYIRIKDYKKALEKLNTYLSNSQKRKEYALINEKINTKASLLANLKQYDSAVFYYQQYITTKDSITLVNQEKNANEYAALMNVEKLHSQNSELILKAQEQTLKERKTIITFLIIIVLVLTIFAIRERKYIEKLKKSEQKLQHTNSELLASQTQLREAKEIAEGASRMKTQFIQNMSHEVRTPLNAIVGFSKLLTQTTEGNEEVKEYSDIITSNSYDLLKLLSDVLTISNLDAGDEESHITQTDINECCQICIETIKPLLHPNVSFEYLPDTQNSSTITTDADTIRQILNNLLHNAVKFTETGKITLSYSICTAEKQLTITVSDTGPGIPVHMQEKIFDRFVKINEFTQGNGLGLSICRLLAQKLHGTIHFDNTCVLGSRFILVIPFQ